MNFNEVVSERDSDRERESSVEVEWRRGERQSLAIHFKLLFVDHSHFFIS